MFLSPGSLGAKSKQSIVTIAKGTLPPEPTLLNTLTATNSASLVDTKTFLNTNYTTFKIIGKRLIFGNSGINASQLFSTNGGTSYDSTAGHYSVAGLAAEGTTVSGQTFTTRAGINFSTISGGQPLCFEELIFLGTSTVVQGQATYINTIPVAEVCMFGGAYTFAPGVNAIQWIPSGGTITSGSIELWGIP